MFGVGPDFGRFVCRGCSDPASGPDPVVYTVTVSWSANGGTVSADPESGPVGTEISLSNVTATDYAFSHYLVNGVPISDDSGSFTLNANASGVFTPDENGGVGADVPIASLGGGSPARLGIPEEGGTAVLDIGTKRFVLKPPNDGRSCYLSLNISR
jgi:hypothetical protein